MAIPEFELSADARALIVLDELERRYEPELADELGLFDDSTEQEAYLGESAGEEYQARLQRLSGVVTFIEDAKKNIFNGDSSTAAFFAELHETGMFQTSPETAVAIELARLGRNLAGTDALSRFIDVVRTDSDSMDAMTAFGVALETITELGLHEEFYAKESYPVAIGDRMADCISMCTDEGLVVIYKTLRADASTGAEAEVVLTFGPSTPPTQ